MITSNVTPYPLRVEDNGHNRRSRWTIGPFASRKAATIALLAVNAYYDLGAALSLALRAVICPCCGRDNANYPEGCTSDDCPGVQALAKATGRTP